MVQSKSENREARRRIRMRRQLLDWFDKNGRQLPWRSTPTLYKVWISEVMLQQTQVATVIDYFQRFIQRFPDPIALAAADEQDVLAIWAGLGYYRRARQLQQAARIIASNYGGQFPSRLENVLQLPGIGRYTAHAILSIADQQRLPIVEGNTERLYARLMGLETNVKSAFGQRQLWEFSASLLPRQRVGDFNQALMDLGSLVCRPRDPACECCPLTNHCQARIRGLQSQLPIKSARKKPSELIFASILFRNRSQWLLLNDPSARWWAGMWDVPRFELPGEIMSTANSCPQVDREQPIVSATRHVIQREFRWISTQLEPPVRVINHVVTNHRIKLYCFLIPLARRKDVCLPRDQRKWRWFGSDELREVGLNKTARQIIDGLLAG